MIDLYRVLGIDRTATPEQVKVAYRRASKKAHPDMQTGSASRFAMVKTAYDTLSDEKRRQHYDETGEIEEKPADNERSRALHCLFTALEAVLGECAQTNHDPITVDIPAAMRIWVRKSLDAEREQLQQIEVFLAKNDAIMRRCGEGVLRELLVSRRRNMQTRREQIARNRAIGADALALLDGVTFENDPITGDSMRRLMRL